jgi:hypothetical protein
MRKSEPEQIGNMLGLISKDMLRLLKIKASWVDISGDILSSHSVPAKLKGSKLEVLCDSPIWCQQLDLLEFTLIENIRKTTKLKIKEIGTKLSVFKQQAKPQLKKNHTFALDIDSSAYENIKNPELREKIKMLVEIIPQS